MAWASFLVGSSNCNPFIYTTSAFDSTSAALGFGSKVWLSLPSGTIPVTVARSPTTLETMLVIGATVVTMTGLPSVAVSDPPLQAEAATTTRTANACRVRNMPSRYCE